MTKAQKNAKLSAPGKMPCPSWSTRAGVTCPFAKTLGGEAVPVCAKCYAMKGRYRFGNVQKAQESREIDSKTESWVSRMVTAIAQNDHFRWFDSGDINSIELAKKILEVMKLTPDTKHWLPTRAYKHVNLRVILEEMASLPNVSVRCSSDDIGNEFQNHTNGRKPVGGISLVVSDPSEITAENVHVCEATTNKDKKTCGDCRACWDTDIDIIAYKLH